MTSLLDNKNVASEAEKCVNVHMIWVKVQPLPHGQAEFLISVSRRIIAIDTIRQYICLSRSRFHTG